MTLQNPTHFPEQGDTLFVQGPAGQLELLAGLPEPGGDVSETVAIICHPHPQHGGTMRNKVVHMIEKSFRDLGAYTVRFNFRGVNESAGNFDDGVGETEDLMAVFEWVRSVKPDCKIWLAGFSFGSFVALKAVHQIEPELMLTVAPPVERYGFSELSPPACAWLLIQGDDDEVVSPKAVYDYVDHSDPKPQLITMKAGHFFHRRLLDLKGAIKNGVRRELTEADTE